jgi:uncharacterized protein (DUF1697 family)
MNGHNPLAKLSAATTALAECTTLEEVKHILDVAEAARTYARAAKLGLEAQNHAAELKLRAERKAGELLAQLERVPGKRNDIEPDSSLESGSQYKTVLAENDIPPVTAHRWQSEAAIPDELFEEHIAEVKGEQREVTSTGLLRLASELKQAAESLDHKWTESELLRRGDVEQGMTVHANMKADFALIEWAKSMGIFERIDRATVWGNPFLLPADGDRLTVVENYQWYLERKPSLLEKIDTLKGKVLGCWCHPEMCHGEVLKDYANDTAD